MKKLLLASCLSIAALLQAQPYQPMLDSVINVWTYTGNMIPVLAPPGGPLQQLQSLSTCQYGNAATSSLYHETAGDTIIDSVSYKILHERDQLMNPAGCLYGFLREDTAQRKVYFLDNLGNPEELIYDFSMQPGDTIPLTFHINNGGYYNSGNYVLDSIRSVTLISGPHKQFFLHESGSSFSHPLVWIEGVGSDKHLVYTYGPNWGMGGLFPNCNSSSYYNDYLQILICFSHQQKIYWDNCAHTQAYQNGCFQYQDSCDFWNICGAIPEFADDATFGLQPNPASGYVTVSLDVFKAGTFSILLRDVTGKQVLSEISLGELGTGSQRRELDLTGFPPGFYFVECRSEDGFMLRKLVKQ